MNLAIIQARVGSSRLPNKVLKTLGDKPALWHVIQRVKRSTMLDEIVVATTIKKEDIQIIKFCADNYIRVFVGSEDDVLDRYYQAARLFRPDNVVRITSDCPLHDAEVIDQVIRKHMEENNDYTSNTLVETFPDGLDCEVMKYSVLCDAWKNARLNYEREHVTQYIIHNATFKKGNVLNDMDKGKERWTLDTEADYKFIKCVYDELYSTNKFFNSKEIYELLEKRPELRELNKNIMRNEGLLKSIRNER